MDSASVCRMLKSLCKALSTACREASCKLCRQEDRPDGRTDEQAGERADERTAGRKLNLPELLHSVTGLHGALLAIPELGKIFLHLGSLFPLQKHLKPSVEFHEGFIELFLVRLHPGAEKLHF